MSLRAVLLAFASVCVLPSVSGTLVWPNVQTDHLEQLLYEQRGFRRPGIPAFVQDCVGIGNATEGRSFGAEWLRTAYHDMATADVFAGTGGMDASIMYETNRAENVGKAFNETLAAFAGLMSSRSSMADLFTLAAIFAVGACSNGTIVIPFRGGRIDATEAGPEGVPEPQQDLASHTAAFARQGFNATEMIGLVACGHSIGGVHGVDFPQIVPFTPDDDPENEHTGNFDITPNFFENRVATEFISNTSTNPLVSGPNVTTRSDERIFNSDGGVMMANMAASNEYFLSTCSTLLGRMLDTVPKSVVLTDPIEFYQVKPWLSSVEININATMTVMGYVRIEDRLLTGSNNQVRLHFAPRNSDACSDPASCLVIVDGTTDTSLSAACIYTKCPASFTLFQYSTLVPMEQGVSSYVVEIVDADTGDSMIYDNGGNGFPIDEALQPQYALSTQMNKFSTDPNGSVSAVQQLNLTVAVLNAEQYTNITATFYTPKNQGEIVGGWNPDVVELTLVQKIEGTNFTHYSTSYTYTSDGVGPHPFDLTATGPGGNVSTSFIEWFNFKFATV